MKRILAVAALTAVVATPAMAQVVYGPSRAPAIDSYAAVEAPTGYGGFGDPVTGYPYAGPHTVVEQGMIVGADPDPGVRQEMRRGSLEFGPQ